MEEKKIPYRQALLWIFLSTLLISGSSIFGWFYYLHLLDRKTSDANYTIVSIVQGSLNGHRLKTEFLMDLLEISPHNPVNLYRFNRREAEKKMLASPLIKSGSIKKIFPGTLYILYEMREPIAYLSDHSNRVIDSEGYVFPFHPFYTPKRLPKIYFGSKEKEDLAGCCLKDDSRFAMSLCMIKGCERLHRHHLFLTQLDLSKAKTEGNACREISLTIDDRNDDLNKQSFILYLPLEKLESKLLQFTSLHQWMVENQKESRHEVMIDMRLSDLAFI